MFTITCTVKKREDTVCNQELVLLGEKEKLKPTPDLLLGGLVLSFQIYRNKWENHRDRILRQEDGVQVNDSWLLPTPPTPNATASNRKNISRWY